MGSGGESQEQLRRLKNTVMGASYRLSQLAGAKDMPGDVIDELGAISRELGETAQRLERLLAVLQHGG